MGKSFILQAMKDVLFLWVLRNITVSHHSGPFGAHLHTHMGMPLASALDPRASLHFAKEGFLKMQARAAHFWANTGRLF